MKTFDKLSIGDKFFQVFTDYRGKEKPTFTEITVIKIAVQEEGKVMSLVINERRTTYSGLVADFVFDISKCNINIIEKDSGFFTTERTEVVKMLQGAAMRFIKEYEADIEKTKHKIKDIRAAYFEYLYEPIKESV